MRANFASLFAPTSLALALSLSAGCAGVGDTTGKEKEETGADDSYVPPVDADGDGVTVADGDCDDDDATLHPNQAESCDGIDNNCNGVVDEGMDDTDDDGTADCMDTEECDGLDNNGDGRVDEGFADDDGNGEADCVGTEACDGVDNDGDGEVDEGYDADGDGYTQCGSDTEAADCDDTDGDIFPDAGEITGDGVDNDCNGLIDEGEWATGDLTITEIMTNPQDVTDPNGEWFEVLNTTDRELILNGVVLQSTVDGEYHMVATEDGSQVTVGAGEFFVFGANDDDVTNGDVLVNYEYMGKYGPDLSLSNETDDLELWAGDVLLDAVSWDDGATMPDPSGASISLDPGYYGDDTNDDPAYWCAATEEWGEPGGDFGSPGAENELCSTWDHDGDGYSGDQGDCDDADDTVYPGAYEEDPLKDNDCDGEVESAPFAVADYDASSTVYTCSPLQLLGEDSFDLEGASLTYAWELTTAPSGSALTTADLETSTDMNPTIHPDLPGDYTFTLTVNDGGADSKPSSITVTVTERPGNNSPTANAGADQSYSSSADCQAISYGASYDCEDCSDYIFTLDGSGSSDADGDELSYSWSITSGSTYGTLSSSTGTGPQLTISGADASYGSANPNEVVVELTVTDCMAATGTDTVTITYYCTGT
jgi:hypothetical protein